MAGSDGFFSEKGSISKQSCILYTSSARIKGDFTSNTENEQQYTITVMI